MPTFERLPRFDKDWAGLSPAEQQRFRRAVASFITDLSAGRPFRQGLRVKRVKSTSDVWEMTFAPDGRATWQYGREIRVGEPHVVWRRVGSLSPWPAPPPGQPAAR